MEPAPWAGSGSAVLNSRYIKAYCRLNIFFNSNNIRQQIVGTGPLRESAQFCSKIGKDKNIQPFYL